jgi:hypothetical protein
MADQKKMEELIDIVNANTRCMRKCGDNSGYGKKYAYNSSDEGSASPGKKAERIDCRGVMDKPL